MLERIGVRSVDELFNAIPGDARSPRLGIGAGMSEQEVQAHLEKLAAMNKTAGSGPFFIGGPIQRRYIPAAVPVLALRGDFLTAYTPYQPEVSQGTLQAVFEYQSLLAELLAMDVVNSSMYDGGSATAEAALMAVRLTGRKKVAVSSDVDFTFRRTLRTYARGAELEIVDVPTDRLASSAEGAACVIVQHPDAFGSLVDMRGVGDRAHIDEGPEGIGVLHDDAGRPGDRRREPVGRDVGDLELRTARVRAQGPAEGEVHIRGHHHLLASGEAYRHERRLGHGGAAVVHR